MNWLGNGSLGRYLLGWIWHCPFSLEYNEYDIFIGEEESGILTHTNGQIHGYIDCTI